MDLQVVVSFASDIGMAIDASPDWILTRHTYNRTKRFYSYHKSYDRGLRHGDTTAAGLCPIAETGTFTSAARRVHVTQAASSAVRQLEREIGTPVSHARRPRRSDARRRSAAVNARAVFCVWHDCSNAELADLAGAEKGGCASGARPHG